MLRKEVTKSLDTWDFEVLYDFVQCFNISYSFVYLVNKLNDIAYDDIEILGMGSDIKGIQAVSNMMIDSQLSYKKLKGVTHLEDYDYNGDNYSKYKVECEYEKWNEESSDYDIETCDPIVVHMHWGYITKVEPYTVATEVMKSMDAELREITAPVMVPEEVDAHGDIYSHEVVRKACRDFNNCMNPNIQHAVNVPTEVMKFVESWVTKCDMELDGHIIKEGTWMATAHVQDDMIWESVKKGEYTGFSIHALAQVEDLTKDNK